MFKVSFTFALKKIEKNLKSIASLSQLDQKNGFEILNFFYFVVLSNTNLRLILDLPLLKMSFTFALKKLEKKISSPLDQKMGQPNFFETLNFL